MKRGYGGQSGQLSEGCWRQTDLIPSALAKLHKIGGISTTRRTNTIHVFQYLMVVWLHIHDSKCIVRICGIAAKCVICDVDIHPDVDYTCHDDPSLYVASLVTLGSHLKYDRQIHALQVLRSFHIVLRC